MSAPVEAPALWLHSERALTDRSITHALLYPVFEFRALALTMESPADELDPFERAVFDTSCAGVVSAAEQSDILGLHRDFVTHLRDRLRAVDLLDHDGRPRRDGSVSVDRSQVAVSLFWDPLAQVLWPRYVRSNERRLVAIQLQAGRLSLAAGTDGDPYDIALFVVQVPNVDPPARPTVDEALGAIRAWSRELRSHKGIDRRDTLDDPAVTVLQGASRSYLVAPTMRGAGQSIEVQDPFGGSSWRPFIRRLSRRANDDRRLARWLGLDPEAQALVEPSDPTTSEREAIAQLLDEVRDVRRRIEGRGKAGAKAQLGLDMIDLAHRLLDRLFESAPRSENIPGTNEDLYRRRAADMLGLELPNAPLSQPAGRPEAATLYERCAALLSRYEPEVPGSLHHIAQRCPALLVNALKASSGNQNDQLLLLLGVAEGLAAGLGPIGWADPLKAGQEGLELNGEGQETADTPDTAESGAGNSDATATVT